MACAKPDLMHTINCHPARSQKQSKIKREDGVLPQRVSAAQNGYDRGVGFVRPLCIASCNAPAFTADCCF